MSLKDIRTKGVDHNESTLINYLCFLAHENEPIDKYKAYLALGAQPHGGSQNSLNIFW